MTIKHKPKGPFDLPALPATINYADVVEHLTEAHTALARLDEMLKHIGKSAAHLERTFFTREAVLSSKIEGTQVTLEDVLKNDAEDGIPEADDEKVRDLEEVMNYRRAIRKGVTMIEAGESLAENNVKNLHKVLLDSARGRTKAPGEFRRDQVYIAPKGTPKEEARYIPPLPSDVPRLYGNFDRYLNAPDSERDPLVQIAVGHYQFEAIHPFKDGNGRVGRLLIPLFLYQRGIIARPLMYISKYFEEHRRDYYDLLADVSYEEAWTPWVRFFLQGVCEQAREATELGRNIIGLRDTYRERLADFHSTYAYNLLDAIFQRPYFTPSLIRKAAHIRTQQSVLNLIEKFQEAGVIADLSPDKQRNKVYGFLPLIRLLEGDERKRK